jgi:hypothetical protein
MRPIVQTVTAGNSLQIPLDMYQRPFNVTADVIINTSGTYTLQASNDDPYSGSVPTNFMPNTTNTAELNLPPAASTTSLQGYSTIPIRQLYLTVSAGSVTIRVMQAGAV